jgi:hypothetical protein
LLSNMEQELLRMYSRGPEKKPSSADGSDISGTDVLSSAVVLSSGIVVIMVLLRN